MELQLQGCKQRAKHAFQTHVKKSWFLHCVDYFSLYNATWFCLLSPGSLCTQWIAEAANQSRATSWYGRPVQWWTTAGLKVLLAWLLYALMFLS